MIPILDEIRPTSKLKICSKFYDNWQPQLNKYASDERSVAIETNQHVVCLLSLSDGIYHNLRVKTSSGSVACW